MSIKTYLTNQSVQIFESKFNGKISVQTLPKLLTRGKTKYKIIAGGLLQSGSIIKQLWQKPLKFVSCENPQKILILGLGGGTVIKQLRQKYPTAQITAVEIDPIMLHIARKYFKLKKSKQLNIVNADAFSYVSSIDQAFDLILVDLFTGETQPQQLYSMSFQQDLKKNLTPIGQIIFNCLFVGHHKQNTEAFIENIESIYQEITLVRSLSNLFIYAKS